MTEQLPQEGELILYRTADDVVRVEVLYESETFWLDQRRMAELFGVGVPAIAKHLANIHATGELDPVATVSKMERVQREGSRAVKREIEFYNLDAIISVGYRVNSAQATQFRIWATQTLREFIVKGFVLDDERLKLNKRFGKDYFDELLERIREIRASERRFYLKIADIYEQCSIDYDKHAETTQTFFKTVQNKLHWAITGKTAAELIAERARRGTSTPGASRNRRCTSTATSRGPLGRWPTTAPSASLRAPFPTPSRSSASDGASDHVGVGARVQDERTRRRGGPSSLETLAGGLDREHLSGLGHVLQIASDYSELDRSGDRCGNLVGGRAIARLQIGAHRARNGRHDPRDAVEHLRPFHAAVGGTTAVGDPGTGGGDRGESGLFQDPCRATVPSIWQDEPGAGSVHRQERRRAFPGRERTHTPDSTARLAPLFPSDVFSSFSTP